MILLTGSTGFIGSAMRENLGLNPCCVIRRSSNSLMGISKVFEIDSLSTQTDWSGAFDGVDTVIHLAGLAHTSSDTSNMLDEFRSVNTFATINLARAAGLAGVKRFIFLSSIGVNGSYSVNPFTENCQPKPSESYAISKYEAELGLIKICKETGMEFVIIRSPLVYGANAPGNFGSLLSLIQSGVPLPFGALSNKRSFISLDNLIDFISLCIQHPKAANEIFLIADGEDISIANFIKLIAKATGKFCFLINVPPQLIMFVTSLVGKRSIAEKLLAPLQVDISKAKNILGWKPKNSVLDQMSKITKT